MADFLTILLFGGLACVCFGADSSLSSTSKTTDEPYIMESSQSGNECDSGYYGFEYATYTVTEGSTSITFEECQFCFCSSSDGSGLTLRCDSAKLEQFFSKISNICDLDCGYEDIEWSDTDCGCPTCATDTSGTEEDDDDLYEDGTSESWDSEYDSYYSLVADFDISLTRVWNSRSDVWAILKAALRLILKNSEDYVEEEVLLYISYFDASKIEAITDSKTSITDRTDATDTTDATTDDATDAIDATDGTTDGTTGTKDGSNGRRRRLSLRSLLETATATDGNGGANDGGEYDTADNGENKGEGDTKTDSNTSNNGNDDNEYTINFVFSITLFDKNDIDGSNIDSWFDYLYSLASSYATDYAINCEYEALDYTSDGFGDVTINSASLVSYDSDGSTIDKISYSETDESTTDGDSGGGASESGTMSGKENIVALNVVLVGSIVFVTYLM